MALQIWLPLNKNGDLKNQGLANVTVTNNGATYNSNGKIGGCYQFNSTNLKGNWSGINGMTKMSGACWVYLTSTSTPQYFFHLGGQSGYPAKFSLQWDSGAVRSQVNGTEKNTGLTLSANTWYHLAVTVDGSKARWYINGVQSQEMDISGAFTASNNFAIGARTAATDGNSFAYYITGNGKLNDVRIYDHCLSPKEVKEISKGLVLHYSLNQEVTKNLVPFNLSADNYTFSDYSNRTLSSIVDGIYHVDGYQQNSSIDTSFTAYSKQYITLNADTDYYLSFYCKSKSASELYFGTSGQAYTGLISNSNVRAYPVTSVSLGTNYIGWVSLKIHTGTDTQYKICLGFDGPNIYGIDSFIEFSSVMLSVAKPNDFVPYESNDIVYDSSGYNNNGTITGTLTTGADTPRYDKSTQIISGATISHPLCIKEPEWTCSCWIYPTSFSSYTYLNNLASGMKITHGTSSLLYINENPAYYKYSHTFELNKWQHVVFVLKHSTRYMAVYKNGVKDTATGPSGGTVPALSSTITLFTGFTGYVSDYREYCTALSEDDVKELYNTAAFIDHKGDVGCYQFYEYGENSKELLPIPTSGVTFNNDCSYLVNGHIYPPTDYIPINPSGKTYYYDIEYSNLNSGNHLYIGFEKYDINKASGSNSECQYLVNTTSVTNHTRVTGTINLATANGTTAAFTKLRVLNNWDNATGTNQAIIHHISLKEVSTLTQNQINKQGQIKSDLFIEADSATVSKYGNVTANQLIEI